MTGTPSSKPLPEGSPSTLTHFNTDGDAHMVDVGDKAVTQRRATAEGRIRMKPETLALIVQGQAKKGDVLGVARLAAIMAVKRTADLIPLCHPLPIEHVSVELRCNPELPGVEVEATVGVGGKTGVEMEALTAVQVGLLTVYDMVKAVDRGMVIDGVRLLEKSGGRSGHFKAEGFGSGESKE